MRVVELAEDLKVPTEVLLTLLRSMGIPVADQRAQVSEADVARVLARVERERRAGKKDAGEAVRAAIEESQPATRRRRRRRAEEVESEPAEVEVAEVEPAEDVETDSDEAEVEVEVAEVEGASDDDEDVVPETELSPEAEAAPQVVEPEVEETAPAAPVESDPPADAEVETEAESGEEDGAKPKRRLKLPSDFAGEPSASAQPASPTPPARPTSVRAAGAPVPVRPAPAASAGPGGQIRIQADGYTADGQKKDKKRGKKRQRVDQDEVADNISRVMAELKGGGKKRRKRGPSGPTREEREEQEMEDAIRKEEEAKTVRVNEFLTVAELSELIDVPSTQLVGAAFKNLGLMITVNQRLDFDQIEMLLDEFNFKAVREEEYSGLEEEEGTEADAPESLRPRAPVVTVMGHVDHGKTLLLDAIRKTNVVAGESGGITQHIGAYHVELDDGRTITFLDTPGHAAFTAMRARGADLTDIVVLVVAADDSIMPQTIEAISHARNAGVPLIVAINKMDLPAANAMKVKQELLQHEVTLEDFGGDTLHAEISAKTRMGIDDLLDKILLQAEILELKANPDRHAEGIVIESKLDVGKGPVVSVLVQRGTLRVGDAFLVGQHTGRVRALLDERGKAVKEAGPGIPVQVLGSPGVPPAGDTLQAMDADRAAEIALTRQRLEREKSLRVKERGLKLGDFSKLLKEGETAQLPIIVKADVDGSVQAVADALSQLSTPEVQVEIVHRAVGAINESDVLLAETARAVIVGFRVRPDTNARHLAEQSGVELNLYEVIYEAVDDVRQAMEGLLSPEQRETILGTAEVREVFKISKLGTVAGCYVTNGVISRKGKARVIRDGISVYTGELSSLKRFKDDAKEVREGFECGIGVANFNDIKVGDTIECYSVEEVARTLTGSAGARV